MSDTIRVAISQEDRRRGFSGEIGIFENVLALPPDRELERQRQVISLSDQKRIYKTDRPVLESIEEGFIIPSPEAQLKGNYLFGGFVRTHFGHFLIECLAPVWGLDHVSEKIDGLVYLTFHDPKQFKGRSKDQLQNFSKEILKGLGVDVPIIFVYEPTQIDRLFLPENGIGFEEKFSGSSPFVNFFRTRNAKVGQVKPSKKRKLYVSRSKVGPRKGHLIGEKALEATFEQAGYEVYYPEDHGLSEQLEAYRQASVIVGVEGSALHLPPFSIDPETKVVIISRRSDNSTLESTFVTQFKNFVGTKPLVVGEHHAFFQPPGANRVLFNCLTVTDFDKLYNALKEHKLLNDKDELYYPSPNDLVKQLEKSSKATKRHYHMFGLEL